jgi:predicted phosphodiesterase
LGDISSDGKTDIVVALPGIGQIAVVSGNNDGTFASAFRSLNAESVSDIRLADMTGDGKLDIVAALTDANSFAIFQYGQAVTISPVATKQGVLVLNGSIGRLQFNNNNLSVALNAGKRQHVSWKLH